MGDDYGFMNPINPEADIAKLVKAESPEDLIMMYKFRDEDQALQWGESLNRAIRLGLTKMQSDLHREARVLCGVKESRAMMYSQTAMGVMNPDFYSNTVGGKFQRKGGRQENT